MAPPHRFLLIRRTAGPSPSCSRCRWETAYTRRATLIIRCIRASRGRTAQTSPPAPSNLIVLRLRPTRTPLDTRNTLVRSGHIHAPERLVLLRVLLLVLHVPWTRCSRPDPAPTRRPRACSSRAPPRPSVRYSMGTSLSPRAPAAEKDDKRNASAPPIIILGASPSCSSYTQARTRVCAQASTSPCRASALLPSAHALPGLCLHKHQRPKDENASAPRRRFAFETKGENREKIEGVCEQANAHLSVRSCPRGTLDSRRRRSWMLSWPWRMWSCKRR
ncbi:hypothetical protein B0H16DRAFT_907242 [Mycena metata]|uniref:Uncharacterized protein n=1 Tax=Mycena metata TaxID=1033252 RepID=A0AAD7IQK4_9AGAR|nr:hypothetical protein B0H16DRAFT_907242 [Mycena metata]